MNKVIRILANGYSHEELVIPSIEPINFGTFGIERGKKNSSFHVKMSFKNMKGYGLSALNIKKVV